MIPSSELIINDDGSVFHLHLRPQDTAQKIILVGDPERVSMVGALMDEQELEVQNREFHTITGIFRGKRISVVSTGIGTDNCDIVLTELDALVNVDFETREIKRDHTTLDIVRCGTSGGLQPECRIGKYVISKKSIGLDGLLYFYDKNESVRDLAMEQELALRINFPKQIPYYVVDADSDLVKKIATTEIIEGITVSANGFYGPQGRKVRLNLGYPQLNHSLENFTSETGLKVTNFEMESSAVAGLSALLGHRAMTICLIIANRIDLNANVDYHAAMKQMLTHVMDKI